MKEFKIDNKGSGRIFSNPILEKLTKTHFAFPVIFYYIISLACIIFSIWDKKIDFISNSWMIPLGFLLFTLVEYLIHRFLFHFHATSKRQTILQYNIHGIHHEFPRDKDRLVMPPVLSILLATGFFFVFRFIVGMNGIIFFSGFIAGYSTYLVIHYAVHALKPPGNFLKVLWKHHSLHHYASVHSAYSVSFPVWDYIFGTMPAGARGKINPSEDKS